MAEHPSVSIVMPVRDESDHIDAALDAALAQDYEGPLEVVVADGGSTDGTFGVVERRAASDSRLTLVDNPDGHAASGLNRAIAASTGDVIVRCDGHAELSPSYVRTAVRVLEETGAANVGGRQAAVGDRPLQRAIATAMTSPLGVGNSRFHYSQTAGPVDTVYLGAFRRSAIESVGGFDESLIRNQDYELNHRLATSGQVVWFDPRLEVTYRPRSSLGGLWRQYFSYGAWKRRMLSRSPGALKVRQLAPPLLVIALLLSIGLLAAGRPIGWLAPAGYGVFLVGGTAVEALRHRPGAMLLAPALVVMHIGWGLGFLVGRARA